MKDMERKPTLQLKIRNFRAIKHADIVLNGITVVVGENGSGKSSISKVLYDTIDLSSRFDRAVYNECQGREQILFQLIGEYNDIIKNYERISSVGIATKTLEQIINFKDNFDDRQDILDYLDYLQNVFVEHITEIRQVVPLTKLERSENMLANSLHLDEPVDILEGVKLIQVEFKKMFAEFDKLVLDRPLNVWSEQMLSTYNSSIDMDLLVYGDNVIDRNTERLGKVNTITSCTYIFTPFMIDANRVTVNVYQRDLLEKITLKRKGHIDYLPTEATFVGQIKNIVKGDVYYEDKIQSRGFKFKTIIGAQEKEIDLDECATGIKSFAILQLLFENGFLSKDSLILLDEPEVHLHPQWVVEYARLIVELNQKFGVRFLIASHDPDMVSAIFNIVKKAEMLDRANFYLATKHDDGTYEFVDTGESINEQFGSFNIALQKIKEFIR